MKFVLDAGAIFSSMDIDGAYTTQEVCAEVRDWQSVQHLERLLASSKLSVVSPSEASRTRARQSAGESGDRLSAADISVVALALDLSGHIITGDYGVQNVASRLGIAWSSAKTEGIKKTLSWRLRCTGCNKRFPGDRKDDTCDVCGSRLVRSRR